jgi:hypothetical protein
MIFASAPDMRPTISCGVAASKNSCICPPGKSVSAGAALR